MMQKNKKNADEVLFENIIPEDFEFKFLVETNFRSGLLTEYYNSQNASGGAEPEDQQANSAEKKRQRFQRFALRIAEDSLFTNSYSISLQGSNKAAAENITKVGNSANELSHIELVAPEENRMLLETIPEIKETINEDWVTQYEQTT
jgi:hypothetical protein